MFVGVFIQDFNMKSRSIQSARLYSEEYEFQSNTLIYFVFDHSIGFEFEDLCFKSGNLYYILMNLCLDFLEDLNCMSLNNKQDLKP